MFFDLWLTELFLDEWYAGSHALFEFTGFWSPGRWGPKRDLRSVGLFGNAGHLVADRLGNESAIYQLPFIRAKMVWTIRLTYRLTGMCRSTIPCIHAVFQIPNGLCLTTSHLPLGWS